jgi:hypothetical protein
VLKPSGHIRAKFASAVRLVTQYWVVRRKCLNQPGPPKSRVDALLSRVPSCLCIGREGGTSVGGEGYPDIITPSVTRRRR